MGAVVNGGCREWSLLWVESVVGGVSLCVHGTITVHTYQTDASMLRRLPLAAFIFG